MFSFLLLVNCSNLYSFVLALKSTFTVFAFKNIDENITKAYKYLEAKIKSLDQDEALVEADIEVGK